MASASNQPKKTYNMNNEMIRKFEEAGFELSLGEVSGKPFARARRKNSKSMKPIFNYYFGSEERRIEFLNNELEGINKVKARRAEEAAAKKAARENVENPFKVGEILYDSWGYEQTNIDFYQVVEVKPKSIMIRRISGEMVPEKQEGISSMSAYVRPVKDSFHGEPILKPLVVSINWEGKVNVRIKSKHGAFCKYDEGRNGVYSSWYA